MPPTVLHLVGSFHQGGSERQAVQLVSLLAGTGRYRVLVASLSADGILRTDIERLGIDPVRSYPLRRFFHPGTVVQVFRFARFMQRERVAVLHTHDFYTNVFGLAAGWLARVPVRIGARRETAGVRTRAQKRVEVLCYRFADAVVANSGSVRDVLVAEGVPQSKAVVIHNGLDMARLRHVGDGGAQGRAAFGIAEDVPMVVLVANLRLPVKDHPTYLKAARDVRRALPAARFLIAGEGELLGPMRQLAVDLGVDDAVTFLGRCGSVGELIQASDVCVLSSRAEGFSNAILEYMGGARPVVATDVGGAREAVADGITGYVVPPGDHVAMADRIVWLLSEPDRARRMGEAGRQVVEERFSSQAQLQKTEELYSRLFRAVPARGGRGGRQGRR